jgi:DNA-binding NarL/FixJ family response regulator
LGLPDGSGLEIIREITQKSAQMSPIIATSGNSGNNIRDDALNAGAAFFIEKPVIDLAGFQQTILAALPQEIKPLGFIPRLAGDCVKPDVQALKDDLDHIDHLVEDSLAGNDDQILSYVAQFLNSLGRDATSKRILQASDNLLAYAKEKTMPHDKIRDEFQVIKDVVDGRLAQSAQVY